MDPDRGQVMDHGFSFRLKSSESQTSMVLLSEVESVHSVHSQTSDTSIPRVGHSEATASKILIKAAILGNIDVIKLILSSEKRDFSCVRSPEAFRTPLHYASLQGHVEILKLLLDNNFSLTAKDWYDNTPLHLAARYGQLEVVKILLEHQLKRMPDCYPISLFQNLNKHGLSPLGSALASPAQYHVAKWILNSSTGNPSKLFPDFSKAYFRNFTSRSHNAPVKIFILGDRGAGKSTLIRSFQKSKSSNILSSLIAKEFSSKHFTGVLTTEIHCLNSLRMVFYDMSSYWDSFNKSGSQSVFIIIINLKKKRKNMLKRLYFWLNFIYHHSSSYPRNEDNKPKVVIIGSHSDWRKIYFEFADNKRLMQVYTDIQKQNPTLCSSFEFIMEPFSLDIRKPLSEEMHNMHTKFYETCLEIASNTKEANLPPSTCYIMSSLFHNKNFASIPSLTIAELSCAIRQKQLDHGELSLYQLLPHDVDGLFEVCIELYKQEQLIVFTNSRAKERANTGGMWIVHNSHLILTAIDNKLSAIIGQNEESLKKFLKHPLDRLYFSYGVISRQFLHRALSKLSSGDTTIDLDDNLLIQILLYFKYAEQVDSKQNKLFFIPGLLCKSTKSCYWKGNHFGFAISITLKAGQNNIVRFFSPRFSQKLILRLICEFLFPLSSVTKASTVQKHTTVWSRGVGWLMSNDIHTKVVINENAIIVNMFSRSESEIACIHLRNRILSIIGEELGKWDKNLETEMYILPYKERDLPVKKFSLSCKRWIPFMKLHESIISPLIHCNGVELNYMLFFEPASFLLNLPAETLRFLSNHQNKMTQSTLGIIYKSFGSARGALVKFLQFPITDKGKTHVKEWLEMTKMTSGKFLEKLDTISIYNLVAFINEMKENGGLSNEADWISIETLQPLGAFHHTKGIECVGFDSYERSPESLNDSPLNYADSSSARTSSAINPISDVFRSTQAPSGNATMNPLSVSDKRITGLFLGATRGFITFPPDSTRANCIKGESSSLTVIEVMEYSNKLPGSEPSKGEISPDSDASSFTSKSDRADEIGDISVMTEKNDGADEIGNISHSSVMTDYSEKDHKNDGATGISHLSVITDCKEKDIDYTATSPTFTKLTLTTGPGKEVETNSKWVTAAGTTNKVTKPTTTIKSKSPPTDTDTTRNRKKYTQSKNGVTAFTRPTSSRASSHTTSGKFPPISSRPTTASEKFTPDKCPASSGSLKHTSSAPVKRPSSPRSLKSTASVTFTPVKCCPVDPRTPAFSSVTATDDVRNIVSEESPAAFSSKARGMQEVRKSSTTNSSELIKATTTSMNEAQKNAPDTSPSSSSSKSLIPRNGARDGTPDKSYLISSTSDFESNSILTTSSGVKTRKNSSTMPSSKYLDPLTNNKSRSRHGAPAPAMASTSGTDVAARTPDNTSFCTCYKYFVPTTSRSGSRNASRDYQTPSSKSVMTHTSSSGAREISANSDKSLGVIGMGIFAFEKSDSGSKSLGKNGLRNESPDKSPATFNSESASQKNESDKTPPTFKSAIAPASRNEMIDVSSILADPPFIDDSRSSVPDKSPLTFGSKPALTSTSGRRVEVSDTASGNLNKFPTTFTFPHSPAKRSRVRNNTRPDESHQRRKSVGEDPHLSPPVAGCGTSEVRKISSTPDKTCRRKELAPTKLPANSTFKFTSRSGVRESILGKPPTSSSSKFPGKIEFKNDSSNSIMVTTGQKGIAGSPDVTSCSNDVPSDDLNSFSERETTADGAANKSSPAIINPKSPTRSRVREMKHRPLTGTNDSKPASTATARRHGSGGSRVATRRMHSIDDKPNLIG